jgi:DNA-binding transcriptional MerR regulator
MRDHVLRIGELAKVAGVSPDTLRFYERRGLLDTPARSAGRYRLYPPSAAERVAFIRKARALGLTLEQVREVLRSAALGTPPCEHVRASLQGRLHEVDARIRELESLRTTLAAALRRSRSRTAAAPCVCEIIESQELTPAHAGSPDGGRGAAPSRNSAVIAHRR